MLNTAVCPHPSQTPIIPSPILPPGDHHVITAKTWKQPKGPSTQEGRNKMWQTQSGILLSHEKCNHAICSNTDVPRDYPISEVTKRNIT